MRYKYQVQFLNEYELGITIDDFNKYSDEIEKHINKGQLGDAALKIKLMKQRANLYKDFDIFYKVASAYYFDDSEDVTTYNFKYNENKIKQFKEAEDMSFFLTVPMTTLFPSLTSSLTDSNQFSKEIKELQDMKKEIDSMILSQ